MLKGRTGFTYLKSMDTPRIASAVGATTVGVAICTHIVRTAMDCESEVQRGLTSLDSTESRGDNSEEREAHTVSMTVKLESKFGGEADECVRRRTATVRISRTEPF